MKKKIQLSLDHKDLIRRYLLWAYKSTRESFERIERKTTQLMVDEYILGHLTKNKSVVPKEFKAYIADKRKDELKLKSHPQYVYLGDRLAAIEAAIKHFLGAKELDHMRKLFEGEFTRRILEARDH